MINDVITSSSSFGPILYHQMLSVVLWSQSTPLCHRRELPNLVSLWRV